MALCRSGLRMGTRPGLRRELLVRKKANEREFRVHTKRASAIRNSVNTRNSTFAHSTSTLTTTALPTLATRRCPAYSAMLRLCQSPIHTQISRTIARHQSSTRFLTTSIRVMSSPPLTSQKCEPCTAALAAMSQDEATQMLSSLKGKWSLSPQPKTLLSSKATHPDALHRTYKFKDLTSAQAFANQLGALAETEGHHPAIMVEWGRVTVWWWSHAINGVSTFLTLHSARQNADIWLMRI